MAPSSSDQLSFLELTFPHVFDFDKWQSVLASDSAQLFMFVLYKFMCFMRIYVNYDVEVSFMEPAGD